VGRHARQRSAEGEGGAAGGGAEGLGPALVGGLDGDVAGGVLGEALWAKAAAARGGSQATIENMARMPAGDQLAALAAASDRLTADFGSWRTPWGEINRFQRLNGDIVQTFRDDGPSIPVPFPAASWGSLASFGAQRWPGAKRYYGTSGNSFVAVVEFGPKVRALAVTAGGESGHPDSPHFNDQAQRYASGDLREVYFWPEQLAGHVERTYRPGEAVAR
jgi:acyl-homoserine-lactone acylase